jgi:2-alkyl-3-oxoalkanoate reductase
MGGEKDKNLMENREIMPEQKKILVTGGGGFLGKAIVMRLVARGERVRSFSRGRYAVLDEMGVEQVQGDLADAEAVSAACEGVGIVFHTAAKAGIWGPREAFFRANVTGTENVIAACRQQGVRRLIYTSSPSAIFDDGDMQGADESAPYPARFHAPYPETKAKAEQLMRAAASNTLATVCLRPHLIWGPEDPHILPGLLARAKRLKRIGDGTNRVDTIYIDNAADAHILADSALKAKPDLSGRVYFISNDDPIPLWEMVDRFLIAGGRPKVQGSVSPKTAYRVGALCEILYRWLGIKSEPPMTRWAAREAATSHWFDISAAKRDLGYAPKISIDEGLVRLRTWLEKTRAA